MEMLNNNNLYMYRIMIQKDIQSKKKTNKVYTIMYSLMVLNNYLLHLFLLNNKTLILLKKMINTITLVNSIYLNHKVCHLQGGRVLNLLNLDNMEIKIILQ